MPRDRDVQLQSSLKIVINTILSDRRKVFFDRSPPGRNRDSQRDRKSPNRTGQRAQMEAIGFSNKTLEAKMSFTEVDAGIRCFFSLHISVKE